MKIKRFLLILLTVLTLWFFLFLLVLPKNFLASDLDSVSWLLLLSRMIEKCQIILSQLENYQVKNGGVSKMTFLTSLTVFFFLEKIDISRSKKTISVTVTKKFCLFWIWNKRFSKFLTCRKIWDGSPKIPMKTLLSLLANSWQIWHRSAKIFFFWEFKSYAPKKKISS